MKTLTKLYDASRKNMNAVESSENTKSELLMLNPRWKKECLV